jgi:SAM-dependent methyltransferase
LDRTRLTIDEQHVGAATPDRLGSRFGALIYDPFLVRGERLGMRARRADLLGAATGRVLEIGAGTGLNLQHYPLGAEELLLTEPEPAMLRRLRARAAGSHRPTPTEVALSAADALPADDASVDTVVSTLVLCTIPDVDAALAEIVRVLRPGGRLLFVEHVRADDARLARSQDRWAGPWAAFAMGCRCNRDTLAALSRRFDIERVKNGRWRGMPWLVRPLIMGAAVPIPDERLALTKP